ncbi:S8 family serine peptidase [Kitasatospora sp. NPDC051984]|uniref:S8 family serine peptidase n=1 Tax=Kitasatospora sp. NPDC051984 TaxID=3364059 RepID=UPI0037C8F6C6
MPRPLPAGPAPVRPLDLIGLGPLMARTAGRPEVAVGLLDGLVAVEQPAFAGRRLRILPGRPDAAGGSLCASAGDGPCVHGSFVAGVLSADRASPAPGICPDCTLLIRPIFAGHRANPLAARAGPLSAPAEELAAAVVEAVDAGARVLNLSVAPERPSGSGHRELTAALDHAAAHDVLTVVAAGNQGRLGSSVLIRHPWTIPVVAYDTRNRPMDLSNLGSSIGTRGLGAPGRAVVHLNPGERPLALAGTSVAVPFVTGTLALLLLLPPGHPVRNPRSRPPRRTALGGTAATERLDRVRAPAAGVDMNGPVGSSA